MPEALGAAASLVASFAVLLLAAKAHGRQVRLERELEGYREVDFRGDNPPWVEALWARDRLTYWGTAALLFAALLAVRFGPLAAPLPLPAGAPAEAWVDAAVLALWAGVGAFSAAGLVSLARFLRRLAVPAVAAEVARDRMAWRVAALRGSALWWGLALAGAGVFWSLAAQA